MYLCDQMKAIVEILGEDDPFFEKSPYVQWMRGKMVEVLDHSEIFIMERSALAAASNLRLGDPDRFERMLRMVLREPGRFFIECSHQQRDDEMGAMLGGEPGPPPEGRYLPQRIALDIHITEPGRALIHPYWCFPKTAAQDVPLDTMGGRLRREALKRFSAMGISFGRIAVDVTKASSQSFSEFVARVEAGNLDPATERAARASLAGRRHTHRQFLQAAWREDRMSAYAEFDFDRTATQALIDNVARSGISPEESLQAAQRDCDGELVHAIALLATLQARRDTTAFEIEERRARSAKKIKRPRFQDMSMPSLSVVSMHKSQRGRSEHRKAATESSGRGRIRHPVSGHLFLARNGKMVWRKEHYRGSLEGTVARRVK